MKDMLVSTTTGLLGSVPVVDLIQQEEKKQNCELVISVLQHAQKIAYINLNCNKISASEYKHLA